MKDIFNSSLPYNEFTQHVTEQIGDLYADVLIYMDTKRDRDALRDLLAHITSMRFAAKLEGRQSRSGVRTAKMSFYNNLVTFTAINKTSLTVRMT